jgi:hypothetical protein
MDLSWLDQLPSFDRRELSPQARAGLSAARVLRPLRGNEAGAAIRELADYHGCDQSTIRRWISKARRELEQDLRHCPDCGDPLPRGCRSSRRYCDQHANTASRVRRHRNRRPDQQPWQKRHT